MAKNKTPTLSELPDDDNKLKPKRQKGQHDVISLTFRVNPRLWRQLHLLAIEDGSSIQYILEQAVQLYMEKKNFSDF